jgi:hypothetical protein
MLRKLSGHLASNVVGYLALFVALGGSSYAAVTLKANSVKAKNIARNAVTSPKVKNGSLLAADFKAGQLKPGAQQGIPGPKGSNGDRGEAGPLIRSEDWHEVLPAGSNGCGGGDRFCDGLRNFGSDNSSVAFYRDPSGVVHLKGLIYNETGVNTSLFFKLPAGYRPAKVAVFAGMTNGTGTAPEEPLRIDINTPGATNGLVGSGSEGGLAMGHWATLEGISFRCSPSGSDGCP